MQVFTDIRITPADAHGCLNPYSYRSSGIFHGKDMPAGRDTITNLFGAGMSPRGLRQYRLAADGAAG